MAKIFETKADLVAASLTAGQLTSTKGYTTAGDGGGATYLIKTAVDYAGTPDEYGDHSLANGNVAVLQTEGFVNVKQYGAVGDGVTDDTAALQAGIDYAASNNLKVTGQGTFYTSSKVVIKCAFDGSSMTYEAHGSPAIALEVSTGSATNPTDILTLTKEDKIILPSLKNMDKPVTGWVGQGVGVRYVNVQNMKITERLIQDFDVGVLHASYSNGCGYSTVQGGYLRNNQINRQFSVGDASGFTNRWDIFGGRYFHSSAEGTETSGVYHVKVDDGATNIINDINFFGASLEGVAEEYHVICGGSHVAFFGCRWESSSPGGIKVRYTNTSSGEGSSNLIIGGRGARNINVTRTGSAANNTILSDYGHNYSSPTATYSKNSSSSADAVNVVLEAGVNEDTADLTTDYSVFTSAQTLLGKRTADTNERVRVEFNNGKVLLGNASAAPTSGIQALGSSGIGLVGNTYIQDGITAPGTITGWAALYVDSADGDLKIKFGDGTVKTIATDT